MGTQPLVGLTLSAIAGLVAVMGAVRTARRSRSVIAVPMAGRRHQRSAAVPQPVGRPIELIARDAQRLGPRFRYVPAGASYARVEARRRAYDEVLGEACRAFEVEHLLGVLPPGPELDLERLRVEAVLGRVGLRLHDAA